MKGDSFVSKLRPSKKAIFEEMGIERHFESIKGEDFYLIKTDVSGIPQFTKIIGGEGNETGGTIIETVDNSLVFFGTSTLGGVPRMTLVKTDKDGNIN